MNTKLEHRTIAGAILSRLRQEILSGAHPGGTQLRQDALAEAYGVSRIPVREALFQLEAEGLVRIQPHRGAVVSEISVAEIRDVFDLRALLEPRLLRASAPRLGADDFKTLARRLEEFATGLEARNVGRWGELNTAFHMALYARADLPRTSAVVASLLQTSDRYTRLQLSRTQALDRADREHKEIVSLLRKKRVGDAARLLVSHIEAVKDDLIQLVGSRTSGSVQVSESALATQVLRDRLQRL